MFLKVCCIADLAEARLAIEGGAAAIGLVSEMPSGPGVIPDELIAEIAAAVPRTTETFLLTARRDADAIVEQHLRCRTTALQLVDQVPAAELRRLRARLPGLRLVQVVHVDGEESVEEAGEVAPLVDTLLLDSGNPRLPVKQLGGTGRVHDWSYSRRIRELSSVPVLLAGGLHPGNARTAIAAVAPAGLDVCGGLRTNGKLDPAKLSAFIAAIA